MSKKAMTPDELEAQADALLAAADNAKASRRERRLPPPVKIRNWERTPLIRTPPAF